MLDKGVLVDDGLSQNGILARWFRIRLVIQPELVFGRAVRLQARIYLVSQSARGDGTIDIEDQVAPL
jgi:hypothetical protein